MTTTESRLLRAVLESPGDDTPRLAYADEIEAAQPERAEFIRVQLALTKEEDESAAFVLHAREQQLWDANKCKWFGDSWAVLYLDSDGEDACGQYQSEAIVGRGFVAAVRAPLAVLVGGECGTCGGRGRYYDGAGWTIDACPACSGTGRVPGIGRELFERQPVTRVEVTDWRPALADTGRGYVWAYPDLGRLASPVRPVDYPHHLYNPGEYPTLDAARDALSAAMVAYFREQCGLTLLA